MGQVFEERASEKVLVRWGLPRGRAEVVAELPWPFPDKTIALTQKSVPKVQSALSRGLEWASECPRLEENEQSVKITKDLTLIWGFSDGHVEAETKYIFRRVRLRIERDELPLVVDIVQKVVSHSGK